MTKELKLVLGREENIVGKGENAGYQHFLLFLQCFQKASFKEVLNVRIAGKGLKALDSVSMTEFKEKATESIY